ncbi:Blp family class II bacteriocin [Streptococcus mutans]|nr:Blp family class II bacteriocin [Streptococcus mutans]
MNTRTLEQFDVMDERALAAVEGGNWGQCIVGTGSSALAGGLAGTGAGAAIGWDLGAISGAGLGWANFCQ